MSWCLNPVAVTRQGLDVGVAFTSGDDYDHPAAESDMMLVLSAVVPWAFRDAKAFQGIDQEVGEARCSLAIALGPSFLSHLKTKIGSINLHNYLGYTNGVDDIYYCNMVGYRLHGYTIIRAKVLAWGAIPIMGTLTRSG